MDIRQLKHFVMVADQANFTRAAKVLHIAQPALSISIKKFEQQLGVQLFHRDEKAVKLTDEGETLYPHAIRILQQVEDAKLAIDETKGLLKGEVRLGAPSMMGSYFFPEIMLAFKRAYPHLKITLSDAGTQSVRAMLLEGTLDIGVIIHRDLPDSLETEDLITSEMVAVVGKDHPLAPRQCIDFQTFFEHEVVMFKPGYFHREVMDQVCHQMQITPDIAFETNLLPTILHLVEHGHSITTLLSLVVEQEPHLIGIPFCEPQPLQLVMAWRKGAYLSYADRAFIEFTKQFIASQDVGSRHGYRNTV